MPRLLPTSLPRRVLTLSSPSPSPSTILRSSGSGSGAASLCRPLSTTSSIRAKDTESTSGWSGHSTEKHAVNRSGNDPQSEGAQTGIKDRQQGKEDSNSQAISGKGGSANEKAKEEHPEAPSPVIGMNEERGEKPQ